MSTRPNARSYVPDSGDIVHVHLAPSVGSQVGAYRAAMILSPAAYNKKTGLILCCALTEQIKGYPFEIVLDAHPGHAALSDQIKSLNWVNSRITLEGHATPDELAQIRAKLRALLFHD